MNLLLAITIGVLFATGIYSLLRRSIVKLVIGVMLIGQGANLLVFTSHGLTPGRPAIIDAGKELLAQPHADPLPQALVLTAIVIGFGVVAFLLALIHQAHRIVGTDDLRAFSRTDTHDD